MKKLKFFSIVTVLLFTSGVLSACSGNPTPLKKIDFEPNNGMAVITIKYNAATESIIPPNPTKNGFTFGGWF